MMQHVKPEHIEEISGRHILSEHPVLSFIILSILLFAVLIIAGEYIFKYLDLREDRKNQNTGQSDSLWKDSKFLWLIFSVGLVAIFEISSLMGYRLQPNIGFPFFAIIILVIGWGTLWGGLKALVKLNFKSIYLLMTVAVIGAFYLGEYEEAAVVIVLFALGERLEQFGIEQK